MRNFESGSRDWFKECDVKDTAVPSSTPCICKRILSGRRRRSALGLGACTADAS